MSEFIVFNYFPIVIVEALLLRAMRWGSVSTCLLDSLVMNFASFICLMLGLAPPITSASPLSMLLYFTYSFGVEAFVLCLLERNTIKKALAASVAANLAGLAYLAIDISFTLGKH